MHTCALHVKNKQTNVLVLIVLFQIEILIITVNVLVDIMIFLDKMSVKNVIQNVKHAKNHLIIVSNVMIKREIY